jgi:hypothetical protein
VRYLALAIAIAHRLALFAHLQLAGGDFGGAAARQRALSRRQLLYLRERHALERSRRLGLFRALNSRARALV